MKEGGPEGMETPRDLVDLEQKALLKLTSLRQDPEAKPEDVQAAKSEYEALRSEREKEDGFVPPEIPEDDGPWQFEKPTSYDLARAGLIERSREVYEEEKEAERQAEEAQKQTENAERIASVKPIEDMSSDELMGYIEYLDNRNREEGKYTVSKAYVGSQLEKAVGRLRELDSHANEVTQEFEAMPEEERRGFAETMRSIGFIVDEKKNQAFSSIFGKLSERFDERGTIGRMLTAAKNSWGKDAEAVKQKEQGLKMGTNRHSAWNAAYLFGNIAKYGRIVTDISGHTAAAPLRWMMLIGNAVNRLGGISKEARLASDEVRDKTWIKDADEAYDAAEKIYKDAEAKAGGKPVSAQDLKDAYRKDLPQEIKERLKKPEIAFWSIQKLVHADLEGSVNRLDSKLKSIDESEDLSQEEKEEEREKLLRRWDHNLKDYDSLVDKYGTVDTLAMLGRYVQAAGKGLMYGSGIAVLEVGLEKLAENISHAFAHSEVPTQIPSPETKGSLEFKPSEPTDRLSGLDTTLPKPSMMGVTIPHQDIEVKLPDNHINVETLADEKGIETIQKGGSVSQSIHAMVDKGEISKKEFLDAWKNPDSVVDVKGEKMHISKMGLVYEGNQVKYIPGENGGPGRFEVLQGSGKEYGSDKDLLARYEELKKPAPKWLEESVTESKIDELNKMEIPKPSMMETHVDMEPVEVKLPETEVHVGETAATDMDPYDKVAKDIQKMSDEEIWSQYFQKEAVKGKYGEIFAKNPRVGEVYNWLADAGVPEGPKSWLSKLLTGAEPSLKDYFGKTPDAEEMKMNFNDFLRRRYLEESLEKLRSK